MPRGYRLLGYSAYAPHRSLSLNDSCGNGTEVPAEKSRRRQGAAKTKGHSATRALGQYGAKPAPRNSSLDLTCIGSAEDASGPFSAAHNIRIEITKNETINRTRSHH